MDDRMETAMAICFLSIGFLMGALMTISGIKAEGFLLEMLGMDLEAARVSAAFGVSSALVLLSGRVMLGCIRNGMAILRKLGTRRRQGTEDLTATGGNEHEAERED